MLVSTIQIRQAKIEDAAIILRFVKELARYEKAESEVKASVLDIEKTIFSQDATTHALICELEGKPIGLAVYFFNYSTWLGKNGLYLEDLYISSEYRNLGAGKAILQYLARTAVKKGLGRFDWAVLNWNEPAIKFYESIGAVAQDEWVTYRLSGKALESFAGNDNP